MQKKKKMLFESGIVLFNKYILLKNTKSLIGEKN